MTRIWLPALRAGSGTDVFTRRLADALVRRGLDARISWFAHHYEFAPFLLGRAAAPVGTEVVLANSWNGFAFRRAGLPLVVTEHHCVFDPEYRPHQTRLQALYHHRLIRPYVLRSLAAASAVTTVSAWTAAGLRRAAGPRDIEVIHNWVDTAWFRPPAQPRPPRQGPFRLLYVGNLSRRKGADRLPHILRALGPAFELRFTGGLRQGQAADLPANMIPLGRPDEAALRAEYQAADALLCPSRFEGFGYSAAEAMACGLPVIAGEAGALAEVLGEGGTGLVCARGEIDDFVAAARRLAEDPAWARTLGEAGRERVEHCFSEAVCLPRWLALIERVRAGAAQAA